MVGDASVPPLIPVPFNEPAIGQGDYHEGEIIRSGWCRCILCLFRVVARRSDSRGVAINPAASGTIVRDRAKVSQWAAQLRCTPSPDRVVTTIAAAAARRTATRVC